MIIGLFAIKNVKSIQNTPPPSERANSTLIHTTTLSSHDKNGWANNYLIRAHIAILNISSDLVENFTYSTIVKILKSKK